MKYALFLMVLSGSLLAQYPVSSRDWLNRGVASYKNGQYQDAVASFTKAVQADPSFMPAHLYLGTAYMQMYIPGAETPDNKAMAANAHVEFQKVLGIDANNVTALSSDASLYLNQKQWDEAKAGYQKVTAVNPTNADAYYSLGFIAWSKWYPAYAHARLDAGMKMEDPGPIPIPVVRQSMKAQWDPVLDEGMRALEQALQIRPDFDDAMAYENLLIRERADLLDDAQQYRAQIQLADEWVQKTLATKKMKAERREKGVGAGIAAPPPPPPPVQRIKAGSPVQMARLLTKVDPVYPPLAKQAKVEGAVTLRFVIGADGHPKNISPVNGHPLLIMAAVDAIKQWVYTPTILNGDGVEVETTETVTFKLP